jgi:hypothetical protein
MITIVLENTALAMAKAYLTSCDPNAILFTMVTMTPSRSGMRKKSKKSGPTLK